MTSKAVSRVNDCEIDISVRVSDIQRWLTDPERSELHYYMGVWKGDPYNREAEKIITLLVIIADLRRVNKINPRNVR